MQKNTKKKIWSKKITSKYYLSKTLHPNWISAKKFNRKMNQNKISKNISPKLILIKKISAKQKFIRKFPQNWFWSKKFPQNENSAENFPKINSDQKNFRKTKIHKEISPKLILIKKISSKQKFRRKFPQNWFSAEKFPQNENSAENFPKIDSQQKNFVKTKIHKEISPKLILIARKLNLGQKMYRKNKKNVLTWIYHLFVIDCMEWMLFSRWRWDSVSPRMLSFLPWNLSESIKPIYFFAPLFLLWIYKKLIFNV